MLGKLTRWLRMLGCDVKYHNNLSDDELIKTAKNEDRILLTCDVQLYKRALMSHVRSYLIKCSTETERLAEITKQFNIKLEINVKNSRCPKCNAKLQDVSKDKVRSIVPQATLCLFEEYWRCLGCGQVYWQGSHWRKIAQKLMEAKVLTSKNKFFYEINSF